jgi:hypothetical protein
MRRLVLNCDPQCMHNMTIKYRKIHHTTQAENYTSSSNPAGVARSLFGFCLLVPVVELGVQGGA